MIVNLFFIGSKFYNESGTIMGFIYHEEKTSKGDYFRSDWGKVELLLANGDKVHIRPATDKEMVWAYKHLDMYKKEK